MTVERRRYFRIQDQVLLKYRVISEEDLAVEQRSAYLDAVQVENVRAALHGIEAEIVEQVQGIRREYPDVAATLELLNRKINILERVVAMEHSSADDDHPHEHVLHEVELSGGGMALLADFPVAAGAKLAVDMILLPSYVALRTFGVAVTCREAGHCRFEIAVEFTDLRDEDRERLIQHVIRKQSEILRTRRA